MSYVIRQPRTEPYEPLYLNFGFTADGEVDRLTASVTQHVEEATQVPTLAEARRAKDALAAGGPPEDFEVECLLPEPTAKELQRLEDHRVRVIGWIRAAEVAVEAKVAFPELITTLNVGVGVSSINGVLIYADLDRPGEVADLLRWLGQKGYRQKAKPDDCPVLQRRTWDLGDVKVLGFFRGEVCKFVQVGTKEEAIYELRCQAKEVSQ